MDDIVNVPVETVTSIYLTPLQNSSVLIVLVCAFLHGITTTAYIRMCTPGYRFPSADCPSSADDAPQVCFPFAVINFIAGLVMLFAWIAYFGSDLTPDDIGVFFLYLGSAYALGVGVTAPFLRCCFCMPSRDGSIRSNCCCLYGKPCCYYEKPVEEEHDKIDPFYFI